MSNFLCPKERDVKAIKEKTIRSQLKVGKGTVNQAEKIKLKNQKGLRRP